MQLCAGTADAEAETGPDEDHTTTLISAPTKPVSSPEDLVWHWITSSVQSAIRRLSTSEEEDNDRQLVISAINQLIKQRELAASKDLLPVLQRAEVARHVGSFPKGFKGAGSDWPELEVRVGNFAALRSLFPDHLPSRHGYSGPPRILGYLARSVWTLPHQTRALVEANKKMRLAFLNRNCDFKMLSSWTTGLGAEPYPDHE